MPLWKTGLLALFAANVADLIILFAGKPFVYAPETFKPLQALSVVQLTTMGVLGAWLVFWLLKKYTKDPRKNFLIASAIFLLISFIPDFLIMGKPPGGMFGGASQGAIYLIMSMHVVAGAIIVGLLLRSQSAQT